MSNLLVWRERLQKIYASYTPYILKTMQFLTGLAIFGMINSNIGYMKSISVFPVTIGLAAICTVFPMMVMALVATFLVLAHFYALSLSVAILAAAVFLLMYIFYFRFTPKKAWIVLLAVLAMGIRLPFVIPIAFGLMGTPSWIVAAACGIMSFYMASSVKTSSAALKNAGSEDMIATAVNFARQYFTNKEMWLMIGTIGLVILIVYLIRTRSVDHAWKIASAAGAAVCVAAGAAGGIFLHVKVSYLMLILSAVLGAILGIVLEFLFFCVDYSGTENIQFEDDEYYYYVKAVPKVGVPAPDVKVKKITDEKENVQEQRRPEDDQEAKITKSAEEILLTRSLSRELGLDQDNQKK